MELFEIRYRLRWQITEDDITPTEFREQLVSNLGDVIRQHINGMPFNDFVQVYMGSNSLHHNYTTHRVTVRDWRQNNEPAKAVLDQMAAILNSNEDFTPDDSFTLDITQVHMPRASGRRKLGTMDFANVIKRKQSVIEIKNKDELCCARALVTAQARHEKDESEEALKDYKEIRQGRSLQERRALRLHQKAGVALGPCGLQEISQFQKVLPEYQIVVVSGNHGNAIIFKGEEREKQLILLLHNQHFDVITSFAGYFGRNYFCVKCMKAFKTDDFNHHRCQGKRCFACHQFDCDGFLQHGSQAAQIKCSDCGRNFFNATCFLNHKTKGDSGENGATVCNTYRKCHDCGRLLIGASSMQQHECDKHDCPSCGEKVNLQSHQCFLQPIEDEEFAKKPKRKREESRPMPEPCEELKHPKLPVNTKPGFVFFDIECRQETGRHEPNLLCAETSFCDKTFTFRGDDCVPDFLKWLMTLVETDVVTNREWICLAHNFSGYDSYFIVEELYKQAIQPRQIVNGSKLIAVYLPGDKVKFIDSLSFFPMALSNFPKTFGLTELKKGFFPHFFNTKENEAYVGPMPAQEFFDPKGMSKQRETEFLAWYEEQVERNMVYNFKEELESYCQSDVRLLKEGCLKFNQDFESICGFNPLEKCLTIASACNRAYRRNWLQEETIAVQPISGWSGSQQNQSHVAKEWLHFVDHELMKEASTTVSILRFEHTIRIGQKHYQVDGFNPLTRTVYEFHGCFFHGCTTCFKNRTQRHLKLNNASCYEVRERTELKTQALREAGYEVQEMWECDWSQLKKDNTKVKTFVEQLELVSPLNPRDAFYGGRTEAIQLLRDVKDHETIQYDDFTSLYPFVNKNCEYPVGHPEITVNPPCETEAERHELLANTFGLMKVKILPPFGLYFPVLPHRESNKLTFPLCSTCVEKEMVKPFHDRTFYCHHNDHERAMIGTWTTPELKEAVAQGYRILHIYERWHFPETSFALFSDYVNTFLKEIAKDSIEALHYCKIDVKIVKNV